jgi:UDP-N-acetylmuramoyl-L-alanyl-D-glutamate--2,6-diaminopimelate ligase
MIRKLKNIGHLFLAIVANVYYGFPSRNIKVIGLTGTDGKTTTTHLIYHILISSGKRASMISTVYAKIGNIEYDTGLHTTTPSSFTIQKFLKKAVENGDEYFVLETTSHGLDQNRSFGIKFHVGVLTNVTHEHLDYHKTYAKYLETKVRLLQNSEIAVLNRDDESYKQIPKSKQKILTYGFKNTSDFSLDFKEFGFELPVFNQYNYLAAYAACSVIGIEKETIITAMKTFILPPGRYEIVYDKDFKIIIDFAHTPNAFEKLLPEIRSMFLKNGGRLIHVFGSAGLRDASKRPLMGKASGKYSDIIILTEEDYRTEDLHKICLDIAKGIVNWAYVKPTRFDIGRSYTIVENREEAIKKAISIAKKDDIVVLTGKAHEKSLCRGKTEYPWDEKKAVLNSIYN